MYYICISLRNEKSVNVVDRMDFRFQLNIVDSMRIPLSCQLFQLFMGVGSGRIGKVMTLPILST